MIPFSLSNWFFFERKNAYAVRCVSMRPEIHASRRESDDFGMQRVKRCWRERTRPIGEVRHKFKSITASTDYPARLTCSRNAAVGVCTRVVFTIRVVYYDSNTSSYSLRDRRTYY